MSDKIGQADAARMIIGPESKRADLLDATDDVVRELVRLRAENERLKADLDGLMEESRGSTEAMDRARVKIEQLRAAIRWLLDATESAIEIRSGGLYVSYASDEYGAPVLDKDIAHAETIATLSQG